MDSSSSFVELEFSSIEGIEGLPIEAFPRVQDIFNDLDWGDSEREHALNIIQEITVSSILEEKHELTSSSSARRTENGTQSLNDELERGYKAQEGGFLEPICTKIEIPKLKAFENETRSSPGEQSETPPASSKSSLELEHTVKKIESSELHVSVQRPTQSKIISPPSSASYSSSSPAALSRYHSGPSSIGITALLDDSEFRNKEEPSISPPAPYMEPVEPANSSVSPPPEKHPLEQPPPPPPPPPPMQSSSIMSSPAASPSSAPNPSPVTNLPGPPPPPHPPPPSPPPPPPPPHSSIPPPSTPRSKAPATPPPPPPPPKSEGAGIVSRSTVPPPPPPRPPGLVQTEVQSTCRQGIPPPPAPLLNGSSKAGDAYSKLHSSATSILGGKGKAQFRGNARTASVSKRTSLKPYHWLKLTRAMQGSIWADAQKPEEASKYVNAFCILIMY